MIRRSDRVITYLGMTVRMLVDAAAEMVRQHLRAEADAEERLAFTQRHLEPVDLAADEIVGVVGAHRAAEDDRAGVLRHGAGQRIAEPRPAHVERKAALAQCVAEAPRSRGLLVHDDQDRLQHGPFESQPGKRRTNQSVTR